ncbi:tRNA 2-thiouridine(34) synthase MnmA [Candidatus Kaiserbacteria bacterium]|nr:MAG: tRNA 2-thiouridine(34) synthase MnmA [Candidatus Kaiserbacteria bacterium]
MKENVFVGVSGGVDSSVALVRVLRAGHRATAVFIKTWQPDFITCNWEKERLDAMRVAAHLEVPFITFDGEEAYKNEVADYMIREYTLGRTPNPDVMCNQHVKFGAFLCFAIEHGATKIATGHYAEVQMNNGRYTLLRGVDSDKDQSYFLWTLSQEQLAHTLFPVGDTEKSEIRIEAKRATLPTSAKHDSQGICFLGPVDIKDFLSHYVDVAPGNVLNEEGQVIGSHDGALYYTRGQRHGFSILPSQDVTRPYYIVEKDTRANTITVSTEQRTCANARVVLSDINLITESLPPTCEAQFRYRQKPFNVSVEMTSESHAMLTVQDAHVDMPSVGQSCVLYAGRACLGGGIINDIL